MLSDRKKGEQEKFPVPKFFYEDEKKSSSEGRKMESRFQSLNVMLSCSLRFLFLPDTMGKENRTREKSYRSVSLFVQELV